jgi:uncharacterized protein (DUF1501 family)
MYGMNPNLLSLMEIWSSNRMAISMATHFAEGNRSHFDCQRWIEVASVSPGAQGVFNRYLQSIPGSDPLRAVRAGSTNLAASVAGSIVVPAINDGGSYKLVNGDWCAGSGCADNQLTTQIQAIGNTPIGNQIERSTRQVGKTMVDTITTVQRATVGYTPTAGGMNYSDGQSGRPSSSLGRGLALVAQLLKANVPVEVAAIDWQGHWDTHENQIGTSVTDQNNGNAKSLKDGADNLLTFWRDLGPLRDNVVVMVGSEFGRTIYENGSKGTDHGAGGAWFAFGGPTNGGLYGQLPALTDANTPGNKAPSVMNYKNMLGEVMLRHLGVQDSLLTTLFPGHAFTNHNMFTRTV